MMSSSSSGFPRRPSSSASQPTSNTSQRPASRISTRPPSSVSQRPQSSASLNRPISSMSVRPGSRVSQRPLSRQARPTTRQSSRLLPFSQTLVTQVTGLTPDGEEDNFRTSVEYVTKSLEQPMKGAAGVDIGVIDRQIAGHAQKARIHNRDMLAEALEVSYQMLKAQFGHNDLDQAIKTSHIPDHLQFLIMLSMPPSASTLTYASTYLSNLRNPPPPRPGLTWKDILAEEPFEGQHWEGAYGLPPGSTKENWEARSRSSTPSLSPVDDSDEDDLTEEDLSLLNSRDSIDSVPLPVDASRKKDTKKNEGEAYNHRKTFEELQGRQYWRPEWRTDASLSRPFHIGDASTLGPSLRRVLQDRRTLKIDGPEQERYINELDATRDVLMALQGRPNLLLTWTLDESNSHSFLPSPNAPRLVHFTLTSQYSIFSSFARTSTILNRLRRFVSAIFTKATHPSSPLHRPSRQNTRTLEAFSEAIDQEIQTFDRWCSEREEEMCRAQAGEGDDLVVSLLSLEKAVRDTFSETFTVLLDVLWNVLSRTSRSQTSDLPREIWLLPDLPARIPPAAATSLLLDTIIQALHERLSMSDTTTSDALTRVFAKTAEPVWSMLGRWLKNGMPVRDPAARNGDAALDDEFFVEDNGMALLEPEFWVDGYTLREGTAQDDVEDVPKTIPIFLAHVAENVLGSGKAIGLLRALGIPLDVDQEGPWLAGWRSFEALLALATPQDFKGSKGTLLSVSTDTLSRVVFDELLPHCQMAGALLAKVLADDCGVWHHLSAIENVFLMRKGDTMSHFADVLFGKMDSHQQWTDFHFLNSAFNDVVSAGDSAQWISASLVRLAYRGKDKHVQRSVKSLDGLLMEYAVPFPLTYVLTPKALQIYGSIFVWLLQVRRAKGVLERILVRDKIGGRLDGGEELKVFYAMRSRLSWFVNTLLNFLTTYVMVIDTQLLTFHDGFRQARSLDEMILLHDDHLGKIQGRCLLQGNTSALHRAIISILDLSLHFSDYFVAFAGDTTHDISRQSLTMKRHRGRHQRKQRRNVIGFSQSLQDPPDSSDDDSDLDEDAPQPPETSFSMATSSMYSADEGFLDKMSVELNGLVRFIRRGVESLAGGTSEAAPIFGVLAFTLEDWDM